MEMVLYGAELIGTIAFALSGTLLAIKKKLDIFGMLVSASSPLWVAVPSVI